MSVKILTLAFVVAAGTVAAQQADARAAYQQRMAVQEVQRLAQQFDQLASNVDLISSRMAKIESGDSTHDLRAEISGLKAQVSELKREQENMRREIVAEISQKMAGLLAKSQPSPAAAPARTKSEKAQSKPRPATPDGPYYEHIVEPGQTLSLIAKGYDTSISKIVSANPGLKPNLLRPGQKIIVPAEDKK